MKPREDSLISMNKATRIVASEELESLVLKALAIQTKNLGNKIVCLKGDGSEVVWLPESLDGLYCCDGVVRPI